ncbi:MAG: hypothetical protein ABEJ23_02595 [Haloarculaceae archaeon]
MATATKGEARQPDVRRLGAAFGVLLLGLVAILGGVVATGHATVTVGVALIGAGYLLVYGGFLATLYLDLGAEPSRLDRPFDGESG